VSVEFLYWASQWLIGLVFLGSMLGTSEAAFHFGRAASRSTFEATKSQISYVQGGILGVLGLLLGFTLAMAVSRFETRKELVVEESNAIGTSYLRAQLVPSPEGSEISSRLRDYVNVRLEYSRASTDLGRQTARDRAARLEDEVWSWAVAFAQKDPRSVTAGLLLQSLNRVIDLEAARWAASVNRVPAPVILVVGLISLLAAVLVGYLYGLGGRRHLLSTAILAAAITAVLLVIIDLDRPQQGLIQVSQQPMIDLQNRLRTPAH